ncbi:MAG: type I-E CRISPR-associated protein Cas6/Cse3/CasE [Promethearchaeota archaeon]
MQVEPATKLGDGAGATLWRSRFEVNPSNPLAASDLRDCYQMHRTVMNGFGEGGRDRHNVLYRVERRAAGRRAVVLVQSTSRPNWDFLYDRGGGWYLRLPRTGEPANPLLVDCSRVLEGVAEDDEMEFVLRANPSRRDAMTGKRVPLDGATRQAEWLVARGERCGFEPTFVHVTSEIAQLGSRGGRGNRNGNGKRTAGPTNRNRTRGRPNRNAHEITLEGVTFRGRLRVIDAAKFRAALVAGVGPGKAYGFGLLTTRPVKGG